MRSNRKNLRIPPPTAHVVFGWSLREEAWNEKKTNKTYWKVVQNMIFKRWLLTKIRYENSESNSKQMNNAKSTWKWNMWGANCQGMMKRIQACLRLCYLLWKLLEYESAESVNFVNVHYKLRSFQGLRFLASSRLNASNCHDHEILTIVNVFFVVNGISRAITTLFLVFPIL